MSVLHHPWHVILVQLIGDIIGSKIKAPSRIKLTSLAFEQRRTCHQLTRVREVSTSAVLLESCARPPVLPSSSTQQIDAAVLKLFMQPQQRLVLPDKCFGLHRESQERRKFRKKNEQGTACSCRTLKQVKAPTKLRAVSNAEHVLLLPHTWPEDYTRIPRIIPATLLAVLQGSHRSIYDSTRLIDCRFEYEYYGGHIRSAEKNSGLEDCVDQLFVSGEPRKSRTLIVLYCEYSMYRAPLIARAIRERDRKENEENYPYLTYPELYVLQGGYHSFYAAHRVDCTPEEYISMDDSRFQAECEQGLDELRSTHKPSRRALIA